MRAYDCKISGNREFWQRNLWRRSVSLWRRLHCGKKLTYVWLCYLNDKYKDMDSPYYESSACLIKIFWNINIVHYIYTLYELGMTS